MTAETIVRLVDATLRIRDRRILAGTSWRIRRGEHWAVIGPNGAGKTTLVRALAGEIPVVQGEIHPAAPAELRRRTALVGFEQQRGLAAAAEREEVYRDFSGTAGGRVLRVRDLLQLPVIPAAGGAGVLPAALQIAPLLDRSVQELSSGELRRFQIALALAAVAPLLILDEPFESLDAATRVDFERLVNGLMNPERAVVLVAHRRREILPNITHALGAKEGRVIFQGPREEVLTRTNLETLFGPPPRALPGPTPPVAVRPPSSGAAPALIELVGVRVAYRRLTLFENLSWTVRAGEHWSISGPNGSGKTTLLRLVAGEHPQAYSNRVIVFGRRRGAEESLSELKAKIGIVSPELQIRYRRSATAFEAVLSGFFDSVGLYRRPSARQSEAAGRWMDALDLRPLSARPIEQLSHGEQRLVLLARAMVKSPRLLILDEPCQGLDFIQRRRILDILDRIAAGGATTLLYVSHHAEELPDCITHRLVLARSAAGPTEASGSRISSRS